jgi:hypothetical protein
MLVKVARVEEVGSSGKVDLSFTEIGRLLRSEVRILLSRWVLGCVIKAGVMPSRQVPSGRVLVLVVKVGVGSCR